MKRILVIALSLVVAFAMATSATASNTEQPLLSEMSDEACMLFLDENGIEMPPIFKTECAWLNFARSVIAQAEENPNMIVYYNAYVMFRCVTEIKNAVNEYYGVSETTSYTQTRSLSELQDNEVYGAWMDSYGDFNAYTYVLDYYVTYDNDGIDTMCYDPGQIRWNLNGNDPDTYYFNQVANAETIADWIQYDLEKIGYSVDYISTTMPNTNVDEHTKLICVRKDDDGIPTGDLVNGEMEYWYDYHVMKKGTDGRWYHKPHTSNPLRYKYSPTHDREWVYEVANFEPPEYFRKDDWTYESEIWFIEYTTPHIWSYVFYDSGQHIKQCIICGEEKLEDCHWIDPSFVGLASHQFTCELCDGRGGTTACTLDYFSFYHPSGTYAHRQICTVCEHVYHEAACTFEYTDNGDDTHTATCTGCDASYTHINDGQWEYSGSGSANTHTMTCADCGYNETENCTMGYRYAGYVNGHNTHIYECTVCKHSSFGAMECMYNSSGVCRACGTSEAYVPVNRIKKEILGE